MNNLKQQINIHNAKLGKDLSAIDYVIIPREYLPILIEGLEEAINHYDYECDLVKEYEALTYLKEVNETT